MHTPRGRLAILVGGGLAPWINSAISAAAIDAVNEHLEVIGIYDGYEHRIQGRIDMVRPLPIAGVSRIHLQGGSILRTSRANPTRKPGDLRRTVQALHELGVQYLATIPSCRSTTCVIHRPVASGSGWWMCTRSIIMSPANI
jgi:ATP-dependent phosphofructokinase / diphosphate-dependent phosphofructokinase